MAVLTAPVFAKALEDAGIIKDRHRITRIVIDVDPSDAVKIHVTYIGDDRLLEVTQLLAGAEVHCG